MWGIVACSVGRVRFDTLHVTLVSALLVCLFVCLFVVYVRVFVLVGLLACLLVCVFVCSSVCAVVVVVVVVDFFVVVVVVVVICMRIRGLCIQCCQQLEHRPLQTRLVSDYDLAVPFDTLCPPCAGAMLMFSVSFQC